MYLKLAAADFASTKSLLDSIKPVLDLSTQSVQNPDKDDKGEDRAKWTFLDWQKKDSLGLSQMESQNPTRFKQLFDAQYAKKR